MRRTLAYLRGEFTVWIVTAVLILAGIGVASVFRLFKLPSKPRWLERAEAPKPTRAQAASTALAPEGQLITIKQHGAVWLPGGQYQLHLDDITGGQVIVSVTDRHEQVIFGPKSVRKKDLFQLPSDQDSELIVEVRRLENILVGGGDFGEFLVKPPAVQEP